MNGNKLDDALVMCKIDRESYVRLCYAFSPAVPEIRPSSEKEEGQGGQGRAILMTCEHPACKLRGIHEKKNAKISARSSTPAVPDELETTELSILSLGVPLVH